MKSPPDQPCALCGRVTKKGCTEHHLIPSTLHSNKWFKKNFTREQMRITKPLCRDCHSAVHKLEPSEKTLGRHWNTIEKLHQHPKIGKFVAWVSKRR